MVGPVQTLVYRLKAAHRTEVACVVRSGSSATQRQGLANSLRSVGNIRRKATGNANGRPCWTNRKAFMMTQIELNSRMMHNQLS